MHITHQAKPDKSPVANQSCSPPKGKKCQKCNPDLLYGGCYNCAAINMSLHGPPPSTYGGVLIVPSHPYLAQAPNLDREVHIMGPQLRNHPNNTDPGNPTTVLLIVDDSVQVGTKLSPAPMLGVVVIPEVSYNVFYRSLGRR